MVYVSGKHTIVTALKNDYCLKKIVFKTKIGIIINVRNIQIMLERIVIMVRGMKIMYNDTIMVIILIVLMLLIVIMIKRILMVYSQ